jgi:ABC-type lipoprotein export system ATPase subunit
VGETSAVLAAVGVGRRYPSAGAVVVALDGVDVAAHAGALTAIVGPSGSGKSTLARLLGCCERPDDGIVLVDGHEVHDAPARQRRALRRRSLATVVAEPVANLLRDRDAGANLRAMGRWRRTDVDVDAALAAVGLAGRAGARVPELSGGEQQRLGLAVATVGAPVAVVADEPTAELDRAAGALVVDVLRALASGGTAVVVATHDPAVVAAADVVVRLDHGRVVAP